MPSPSIIPSLRSAQTRGWQSRYKIRDHWKVDIKSGLSVATLLIPQAVAYASLANLPPQLGLYASIASLLCYSIIGGSAQLAIGPAAIDALMLGSIVAASLTMTEQSSPDDYIRLAIVGTALVGLWQLLLSLLRASFLVQFVSRAVLRAVTTGAAVLILSSQLSPLLGFKQNSSKWYYRWNDLFDVVSTADINSGLNLAIGILTLLSLILLKRYRPTWPATLLALLLSALGAGLFSWRGGDMVMSQAIAVQDSLDIAVPTFQWSEIEMMLLPTLALAAISFVESISVAKVFAREHRYEIEPGRELFALGLSNIASSLVGGMSVAGGLSRSSAQNESGAKTAIASLTVMVAVVLAVTVGGGAIAYLPRSAVAAVVIFSVVKLIDLKIVTQLWSYSRHDAYVWMGTVMATLGLGLASGLAVGVALSLVFFIQRSTQPHAAILGELPSGKHYRNILNFPEAKTIPGLTILRLDAAFYFGNVSFFRDYIERIAFAKERPKILLMDASAVNDVDDSAIDALFAIRSFLAEEGIELWLSHIKSPARERLQLSGLFESLGAERIYLDTAEAVSAYREKVVVMS